MIARQLGERHHGMIVRVDRKVYGIRMVEHAPSQAVIVTVSGSRRPLVLNPDTEIEVSA